MSSTNFTYHQLASHHFPAIPDLKTYLERTRRNRHWVGSEANQLRLRDLRVGIAGLGGMGSGVAEILVRLGIGHLKIADPDTIETSNINRQVIANRHTVGIKKTLACATDLRNISEDIEIVVYDQGLTESNASEFVSDLDILVDEIDVSPLMAHVWLHRAAQKRFLPIYSGYIVGMGTHIYKFQGTDYTFEDFMLHRQDMIDRPTFEFLVDRFAYPLPSYMDSKEGLESFIENAKETSVPIFGASTSVSQGSLAIRLVSDFLELDRKHNAPPTPQMPKFIKLDPLELSFRVCDARERRTRKAA